MSQEEEKKMGRAKARRKEEGRRKKGEGGDVRDYELVVGYDSIGCRLGCG